MRQRETGGETQTSHRPRPKRAQSQQVTPGNTSASKPHSPLVLSQVLSSLGGGGEMKGLLVAMRPGPGLREDVKAQPRSNRRAGAGGGTGDAYSHCPAPAERPSRSCYTCESSWLRRL